MGPRPVSQIVIATLIGIDLLVADVLTWRGTGMFLAASAMFLGVLGIGLLGAALTKSADLLSAPAWMTLPMVILLVCALVLLFSESKFHAEKWRAWKAHMSKISYLDMLLFRHIPNLRR